MEHKNIVATIYLKNGQAVKGMDNFEPMGWDVISLARLYNDSGIDKIIIFDLSDDDEEHEKNIHTIKNINRNVEIKVCAGGNISRFEDVKKFIYAGCLQVIVNGATIFLCSIFKNSPFQHFLNKPYTFFFCDIYLRQISAGIASFPTGCLLWTTHP